MKLDDHIDALRALDGDDAELAGATRLRVRRSLERGHGMRRHAGIVAALAVLLVASASWALATKVWRRPAPAIETPAPLVVPTPAPKIAVAPAPIVEPPVVVETPAPILDVPAPVTPKKLKPVATVSPLYRRAHDLYFHDRDYDAALAAWDAYLAGEPKGQFVVEARYNRALCLVHLSRFAEAHDALLPFANGEVEPAGYRQDEAKQLEAKLSIRLNGTP